MADYTDEVEEGEGDVSKFPTPPRHAEDTKKEVDGAANHIVEIMMDEDPNFFTLAELAPSIFANLLGHTVAMILGTRAEAYRQRFFAGYDEGISDIRDLVNEMEEDND